MPDITLIAHNIRSVHNVGSLLRTADGLGIKCVYLTGYSPYPLQENDSRLPHLASKLDAQIHKTALGAEKSVAWEYNEDIFAIFEKLRRDDYEVAALEQTDKSVALPNFKTPPKLAIVVGREVEGLEPEVLEVVDLCLEIPMLGQKESFNVAQAAAMALYHTRHFPS